LVRKFWSRQPGSKIRPMLIGKLYPYIFGDPRLKHTLQAFFASGLEKTEDPFYSHMIRWGNTSRSKTFFSRGLNEAIGRYSGYEDLKAHLPKTFDRWNHLSKAQFLEMQVFLSNYLLSSQGDRVAMAHSVEIRLPFLDYRIIEFMGRISPKWKIRGLKEKYILKEVFRSVLPDVILNRPKHPYRAPVFQSLLNGNADRLADSLSPGALRKGGLFDTEKVEKLIVKLRRTNHATEVEAMALAGILSSQLLFQRFVDSFPYNQCPRILPTIFVDRRTSL